jgi:tellurite resistance protein TerC
MSEGPLFWVLFNAFVVGLLALDHFVFRRGGRAQRFRAALAWSALLVLLAAAFAGLLYFWRGPAKTLEFATGYLIEESLSVDNLFVFLLLFRYFAVPIAHQRKVLTWGILGALVMRGIFIIAGVSLIGRFHWIIYLFGAFLIFTGARLLRGQSSEVHPERNWLLRAARRFFPITADFAGGKFFVRQPGLMATPLLLVLLVVESTDLMFATDSVPAVLAISRDPFIVYTSNVFAILGLRALYFTLAGLMEAFHLLHYGLAAILMFVGAKMLLSVRYEISTPISLGVVAGVLAISIAASVLFRTSDHGIIGSSDHR